MKRLVFTFGTLFEDDIIKALLGVIPRHFSAELPAHELYIGVFMQMPTSAQQRLESRVDKDTFTFLFAKPGPVESVVSGRAYEIGLEQELILDNWELYPDWYRKKAVTIRTRDAVEHLAYIYTVDYEGQKLVDSTRMVNNRAEVIANAKSARQRVLEKFPEAFK